jgi:hypothetical protein
MKMKFFSSLLLGVGVLFAGPPAFAHHGNAAYDETKPLTLKGTVTKFMWANPHTQIFFDSKDTKGEVIHWDVETLSPGKLARDGWSENVVKPGDHVTVIFSPAKDGTPKGFLQRIVFSDGKQLNMLEHPQ